jgi:cobalt-zinc-cadmium efflux system protein
MTQARRLLIVLGLNLLMVGGLVVVGLLTRSLGVLAAAADYIADSTAIGLGLVAIALRTRSGGQSRATTVVAGINAAALLVITLVVSVEAVRRISGRAPHLDGLPVLVVSAIATVVMVAGALVLGGDHDGDLHMRSVVLDTVADAVSAAAVAVTGAVIYWTDRWYWLDSAVALVIGLVVSYHAVRLLVDVRRALRTRTNVA